MTKFTINRRQLVVAGFAGLALPSIITKPAKANAITTIKDRGKLLVGIQGDNQPFGFVNTGGTQEGLDATISKMFAEELGVEVEYVQMANPGRIPALNADRVDVLFACLSMAVERAKAVQFSKPYSAMYSNLIAPKTTVVKSNEDMGKLVIGVPRSSTQDTAITAKAPKGTVIHRYEDDSTAMQALLSGQVEAVGGIMTYMPRLNEKRPDYYEEKLEFERLYQGAGTRLGEVEINAAINAFIDKIKANGQLKQVYTQWLQIPLPEFPDAIEGIPFSVT